MQTKLIFEDWSWQSWQCPEPFPFIWLILLAPSRYFWSKAGRFRSKVLEGICQDEKWWGRYGFPLSIPQEMDPGVCGGASWGLRIMITGGWAGIRSLPSTLCTRGRVWLQPLPVGAGTLSWVEARREVQVHLPLRSAETPALLSMDADTLCFSLKSR